MNTVNKLNLVLGTIYVNGQEVVTTMDSCSSITMIHHCITIKNNETRYETANASSQEVNLVMRNQLEMNVDTVMEKDTDIKDNHFPIRQRAVTNHLHFPFGNDGTSECDNHMKGSRLVTEEVEKFDNKVGYGCRTSAWYIMYNNHLRLQANDNL